jgi:zinc/manganese transport system substrate-binding protein
MRNLCAVLCALLASSEPAFAKLKVVTTLEDLASIAGAVGGDRIETLALAKGYQDPHYVDAKPSFVLRLSRADLLIVAGLDLEAGYLPPLLEQSRNERIRPGGRGYLDASQGCEILGRPTGVVTRAMGDVHPFGNPHYWTDPENGGVIARAIAAKLSELDAAGKDQYAKNLADFESRLREKEKTWQAKMAPYAGTKVVTFHDSWPNFTQRFRLTVAGHVEPKPGIPASPSHVLELVNLMREQQIRLILVEPYFDLKTPNAIAAQAGATVLTLYPSVGGTPQMPDYFALFDHNLDVLSAALSASAKPAAKP